MKTSYLLIIFSILFTAELQAYQGFHCIPSMRDSRIQVLVQGENVEVLVTNPMGYQFMPQFDSPNSAYQLSFNKMQAEDLKSLGDQFQFTWSKNLCKINTEQFSMSCQGPAKNTVRTVKAYGVSTTEITERYDNDLFEKRKFRFSFEKDNMYFVSLLFDIKNCETFK